MSKWVNTLYSTRLAGRRGTNTDIETTLRKTLWQRGLRYRLHPRLGERLTADFLLVPSKVCVFVDGCFWHQCPNHKPAPSRGANRDLWLAKFARTQERDDRAVRLAKAIGYLPIRVWECDVARDVDAVARSIAHMAKTKA